MKNEELLQKEQNSRKITATLQTVVLAITIIGATWTIVNKITTFENNLDITMKRSEENAAAIASLRVAANSDAALRGEQTALNRAILDSLNEIKRRLESIEQRNYRENRTQP